jgi:hypothetical protein
MIVRCAARAAGADDKPARVQWGGGVGGRLARPQGTVVQRLAMPSKVSFGLRLIFSLLATCYYFLLAYFLLTTFYLLLFTFSIARAWKA